MARVIYIQDGTGFTMAIKDAYEFVRQNPGYVVIPL